MNGDDLMKADYEHFSESLWRNEEIGEKRVSYFVSLITAVLAALVSLIASGVIDFSVPGVRVVIIGLLSLLLVLGGITFLRMLHRNKVTDEYIGVLNYIRARASQDLGGNYQLPLKGGGWWLKGGLAETVAAMNGLVAGSIAFAILEGRHLTRVASASTEGPFPWSGEMPTAIIPAVHARSSLIVVIVILLVWVASAIPIVHRSFKRRRKQKTPVALDSTGFRAGVGALITNEAGLILAFERKGYRDAWQLPQGGIENDETPIESVFREVREETGIARDHLRLLRETPVMTVYELPEQYRSDKTGRGQAHYWFAFRFTGEDQDITLGDQKEFSRYAWMDKEQLLEKVIAFRTEAYQQVFRGYSTFLK